MRERSVASLSGGRSKHPVLFWTVFFSEDIWGESAHGRQSFSLEEVANKLLPCLIFRRRELLVVGAIVIAGLMVPRWLYFWREGKAYILVYAPR